jgi:hypothetical protein
VPFAISALLLAVGVVGALFIDPTRKLLEPAPSERVHDTLLPGASAAAGS